MAENGTLEIVRKNGIGLDEIVLKCATCRVALEYFAGGSVNFLTERIRKHKCDPDRLARLSKVKELQEEIWKLKVGDPDEF